MKKRVVMIALLLSVPVYIGTMASDDDDESSITTSSLSSSSYADDTDDVAEMILGAPGKHARRQEVKALVDDHLSGLPKQKRHQLKEHLKALSDEEYASVIQKMGITRDRKGRERRRQKVDVATVLLAVVEQLKEQNANMASSGDIEQKAYEQQVASAEFVQYMWRNRFWGAIGAAILTNGIQFGFNMWQATDEPSC